MINTARLLKRRAVVIVDGRELVIIPQRRTTKPKARRRLWHWLASTRQNKE